MLTKAQYNYFNNMIAIAYVDGDISAQELEFLMRKADEYQVSITDLEALISDASNLKVVIPTHISQRIHYLDECIDMIKCDGIIHPKELQLCTEICEQFGFDEKYLQEMLVMKNVVVSV